MSNGDQTSPEPSGVDHDFTAGCSFLRYDEAGRIVQVGRQALGYTQIAMLRGERMLAEDANYDVHYVDLSGPTPRKRVKSASPVTLAGNVLAGVPAGSVVEVYDPAWGPTRYPVEAGEVELTFAHPGAYRVTVHQVRHTPAVFAIEVP